MDQVLDLHIHSKYSRACSSKINLYNIDDFCRIKGVDVVATGDFTYPSWLEMIKEELEEIGSSGLYKHKKREDSKIKFLLSTELALIYKDGDKVRRIHVMVHAPNREAAEKLVDYLDKRYNIRSDGRPILGMTAPDLVKLCLGIDPRFLIYPAHIWTPWFAVFGSKSGFNSMEECFHEQTEHIYAYETGLSSDPEMNWRISALDKLTTLSSSDAHSLPNIGREANVMDLEEVSYSEVYEVIKNKDLNKFLETIEFYSVEGMYHYDGHRSCGVSFKPQETKKHKNICPVCKKPLTVGVMNRVEELADREEGFVPEEHTPFRKLVELDKIIAESLGIKSRNSRKVQGVYEELIDQAGSELHILMEADLDRLKEYADPVIVEGVSRVRKGDLMVRPGFDGQYGEVSIFKPEEKKDKQPSLF